MNYDMTAAYMFIVLTNKLYTLSGKVEEYDNPTKLMETEGSLFRELVEEYCAYTSNGTT
jgi:hypothetical protein